MRVVLDDQTLAETTRAMFLFATSLPVRYYIPRSDVRLDLLVERIAGLINFFNERVDAIFVGGVEMPRPHTPWS